MEFLFEPEFLSSSPQTEMEYLNFSFVLSSAPPGIAAYAFLASSFQAPSHEIYVKATEKLPLESAVEKEATYQLKDEATPAKARRKRKFIKKVLSSRPLLSPLPSFIW